MKDYPPEYDAELDYGYPDILAEMGERSTGRWEWDKAHLVFTGKDADLEPWGQQALELISVTEDTVYFKLHCGATIPGNDVCLNLPAELEKDDSGIDRYDAVRQVYLDQAQEIVCGTGTNFGGYWSGDDWWIGYEVDYEVPMLLDDDGVPKVKEIVDLMEKAAEPDIEHWEKELGMAHKALDLLSGWGDGKGNRVPEGQVVEGSVFWLWDTYYKDQED